MGPPWSSRDVVKCWLPHTRCNANVTEQKSHHGAVTRKDRSLAAETGCLNWHGGSRDRGRDT